MKKFEEGEIVWMVGEREKLIEVSEGNRIMK